MTFRHDFACMVNPFIVSLDMTKMIDILEEIIKTLQYICIDSTTMGQRKRQLCERRLIHL